MTETNREPGSETERRQAPADRVLFGAPVEVGGALGPSFEARAVDLSLEGMHLRTAYVPEVGQPLTCRFEVGPDVALVSGEVIWREATEEGGDFGMRFTNLDPDSAALVERIVTTPPVFGPQGPGSRVRLHIDGLASPMRARVKGAASAELVVGSELGFLRVGKKLELEDATTGGKKGARIDRVTVEIDPETKVPQLVVTLRYGDAPADAKPADDTPEPSVIDGDKEAKEGLTDPSGMSEPFPLVRGGMGQALHQASAKLGPALVSLGSRAKTTWKLLAAKKAAEAAPAPRRTTAPPPSGALSAKGRKVVRTERLSATLEAPEPKGGKRRGYMMGAGLAVAVMFALVAMHKPKPTAEAPAPTPSPEPSVTALAAAAPGPLPSAPLAPTTLTPPPEEVLQPSTVPADDTDKHAHKKPMHVVPFGNGPVAHANVLRLKLDGAIEKIEGATTPTGFTVVVPDRRSIEAAGPLAAKDPRIAAVRITNEPTGAELVMSFKDGVPNYQVRARGETLEIALATTGRTSDDDGPKPTSKHRRTHHTAN